MVFLFLVLPGAAVAQSDSDLAAKADALIAPIAKADRFSGAVLVARGGKPVFRKAYGLANREWNVPNDPETKFRIGSITKQFTAMAILQLQEAGKLSVDDPVSKYYTDAPAAWSAITLKHLLTHTSGIPSYTSIPHFFDAEARRDRTPEEIIKLTADKPLEFEPGSKFAYDNSGYILLGYIIEKVSGETYADYIQHHIFDPLGMKSSGYDVSTVVLPKRAAGYSRSKNGLINTPYLSMTEPFAAGSLYSTVDDMLIWDQALTAGKLLSPASYQAMFTDYGHHYGFGWFIDDQFGHQHIWHEGGINGFVTEFSRYPQDKLTVLVFSNQDGRPVGGIDNGLAALYLKVPPRTAAAGGEALLRRAIETLRAGAPDYDTMGPQLAAATRAQLPMLQKTITGLGAIKTITLLSAEPGGGDRYDVALQNGNTEWTIVVSKDGKLAGANFNPAP
ncbi:MAG TPA: serine hydrolase domain-containing protein [Rhizomicrobium sp.]